MSLRNFTNSTTIGALTAPVASSAVTLTVSGFTGYPATPFTATVDRNTATEEIVLVTAVASGTLTVTRGYDGTAAQAHSAGAAIEHTVGAIEFIEANSHINATTGVHGASGELVSTAATQTILSKTLISPIVQADATLGDAVVAYVPTAAGSKNLFRGMGPSGADVITVDNAGNVNAATLASTGATNVHGNLTVTGTSALTGAATLSGGATVPTGQKLTLTDAPAATTDASNKSYVDGKTWPSTKISDAASAATASVVVKRDAAGRAQFVDPSAAQDAATKNYVDTSITTATTRQRIWVFPRSSLNNSDTLPTTGMTSVISGSIGSAPQGDYAIDTRLVVSNTSSGAGFMRTTANGTSVAPGTSDARADTQTNRCVVTQRGYLSAYAGGNLTFVANYQGSTGGTPSIWTDGSEVVVTYLGPH